MEIGVRQWWGEGQGYIRKGGGVGWDTPPPWVPLWSPLKAGRESLSLNSLDAKGAEAKFWVSASNIGRGGGWLRGGVPRPSSYGVRPF